MFEVPKSQFFPVPPKGCGVCWALLLAVGALLSPAGFAGTSVVNGVLQASTPDLKVSFLGPNVQTVTNLVTNEENISQPGPGWMDVSTQHTSTGQLQPGSWKIQKDPVTGADMGVISATDSSRTATISVETDSVTNEIVFSFQGKSKSAGLRYVFFGLQGFDPAKGRFLLPAHAGVYFDINTTPPMLSMEYPTHWEAQFVVYETSEGGVLIYARDPRPYFKCLNMTRGYGTLDLGLQVYATGPWSTADETPAVEWRMKAFKGSWRNAVDTYKSWSENVWAKRPPASSRDWVKNIKSVITIINPVVDYIDALAKQVNPAQTLLYVADWRQDSYDVNYPDYTPGPVIADFIKRSHQFGFHVMLHTNALGVATYNSAYAEVSKYQLRDPDTGDLVYWPQGLWPAGPPPPFFIQSFAFISPCASSYRSLFINALRPMVAALNPDAVHLDAGGVMLNDGNGLIEGMTSIEGMIQLHKDVDAAFPQLAFSYESMTEVLSSYESFAQRWNADFPPHPISTYLMGDRVEFYGFLDQPPPDEPGFIDYIDKYEAEGIMPTIPINSLSDVTNPQPITAHVFNMMRLWQKYDLQPDWTGNWNGLDFRYVSSNGSTSAQLVAGSDALQLKVGNQNVYQRVLNTSSLKTSSFIANWAAYDNTTLYGLNPANQYWLDSTLPRPTNVQHLTNLPGNVSLGTGTLVTSKYGYYEVDAIAPQAYDLIQNFSNATMGTDLAKKDFPMGGGDLVQVTRASIAGQEKSPVILMQPPYQLLGGAVFLDYPVPVPTGGPVKLHFSAGISDAGVASQGMIFLLRINGADVWSATIKLGQLVSANVDLTPWAGQTIHLRFIVHPALLNPIGDLGCWADLSITMQQNIYPISLGAIVPKGTSSPAIGGSVQLKPQGQPQTYSAVAASPGRFAIFNQPPSQVKIGQSLMDLPFDVWKQGYGGWPFPFVVSSSGTIVPIASGGVVERALQTSPPANGLTIVTWGIHIPASASKFNFKFALADPLPPLPATVSYSQTAFLININGEPVWTETIQLNGWNTRSVDISKWAGQNVVFEIAVDPLGQGTFNWSDWAGLTVN
jgi:hypothetical protein